MATSKEYLQYLLSKIANIGVIYAKKMFGEYLIYINDIATLLVCDNQVFVKINEITKELFKNEVQVAFPYPKAKMHYLLDIESNNFAQLVINVNHALAINISKKEPKK